MIDKKKNNLDLLSLNSQVEIVRIDSEGGVLKKTMTYGDWKSFKKKAGYTYIAYQIGFSQFNK